MVNFGLLTAEIRWRVWGTRANFNGFRVLAVLLHGTLVVGVSQTLRRSTEGATYIRQGDHHVGHWPTFLVFAFCISVQPCGNIRSSSVTAVHPFILRLLWQPRRHVYITHGADRQYLYIG